MLGLEVMKIMAQRAAAFDQGGGGGGVRGGGVFIRISITKEDPPNAHQAQRRPKPRFDECVAAVHS